MLGLKKKKNSQKIAFFELQDKLNILVSSLEIKMVKI